MIKIILQFTLVFVALPMGHSDADFFKYKNLRSGYAPPGQTVPTKPPTNVTRLTTPTTKPTPQPQDNDFQTLALPIINNYRNLHHADPLSLNSTLSTFAVGCAKGYKGDTKWADVTDATSPLSASTSVTTPCTKTGGGNELLVLVEFGNPTSRMIASINAWEEEMYNFVTPDPTALPDAERRTQMLWKATKEVGWGCDDKSPISVAVDGKFYMICSVLFKPKGNVKNAAGDPVLPSYIQNVRAA